MWEYFEQMRTSWPTWFSVVSYDWLQAREQMTAKCMNHVKYEIREKMYRDGCFPAQYSPAGRALDPRGPRPMFDPKHRAW